MCDNNEIQSGDGDQAPKQYNDDKMSSSDDSSSTTSSDESSPKKKKRRWRKEQRRSNKAIKRLSRQVHDLRSLFYRPNSQPSEIQEFHDENITNSPINESFNGHQPDVPLTNKPDFNISLETTLKAPTVPKTPVGYVESLKSLQRFEDQTWSDVRFSEVEKTYLHSPGFVELETNDEVKAYESSKNAAYMEKSFAALTFALLKQRESLENGLREFIKWNQDIDLVSSTDVKDKLESIFLKGDFFKVTTDALQMVCGHRADIVQQRRDAILKHVKDPLVRSTLKKVPPSCTNLFEPQAFTTALEKAGGVRKTFWTHKSNPTASAAQAGSSGNNRRPAQGSAYSYAMPAQGYNAKNSMPAQGNTYYPPTQGVQRYRPAQGPNSSGNQRGANHGNLPFRGRGGHQNRRTDTRAATKRSASPSYRERTKNDKRRRF
ncbi:hypothetical protein JYU34_012062 [Plutella xylostella]|uniref:Uncharacterized protein n=1 Tax=Plutella xylostella TaxID=51655 RepID=A0ABQ7QHW7_PLUXY|nr:hypothetical protein JYU34_012062 [Plutella xylostella]